ncbi:hypothetical protein KIH74_29145 [Kineosporia sp. J2-2]|uniref:DUF6745 domain-containing protein n=1 Tax=Kineosporia corallincola TaxID=2835133 RepID=A0ABS5TPL4_9ACTN|nr:hypothetical protein [Kineosporia corallincola]MBT0773045.1 hypothetical protein [Kineosporia corallincola]
MPHEATTPGDATSGSAFVARWIAASLGTSPLTDADRHTVRAGLASLHEGLGLHWHGNVVWVRSPQELTRALADAPALMRGAYLAAGGRSRPLARAGRFGRALSQGTMVTGYAFIAAMLAFFPSYYAGSLVDAAGGHRLAPGGLFAVSVLVTVLTGLFAAAVLTRSAVNSARRVYAPIGEDLDQRLRPVLSHGRPGASDAGVPVRRAVSGLWNERLLEHAWSEGTTVRGFHRDGALHDRWAAGAAGQAALREAGLSTLNRRNQAVLAGLLDVRKALVWVPYSWVTVVLEPPVQMHTETAGEGLRLHRDDGPALVWPDGQVEFYLHGVRIPAELAGREPTVRELHAERNSEVRRVLIEREGWSHYITRAGLRLIGAAPDPGNPGRELRLYRTPPRVFDSDRLLLMTNGSPDRTGTLRHYAELVPGELDDPIEAAAWQYGVPAEVYRELARRT